MLVHAERIENNVNRITTIVNIFYCAAGQLPNSLLMGEHYHYCYITTQNLRKAKKLPHKLKVVYSTKEDMLQYTNIWLDFHKHY